MRIILTGGGSGGHFYPLIAVARSIRNLAEVQKITNLELIYASDEPFDSKLLQEEDIRFLAIPAGKIRRYFSIKNIFDPFKTFFGVIRAIWIIYLNLPDVVFGKGGYASFPTLYAARILGVPIIIHETDAVPGKVIKCASRFAKRIAISFPEAAKFFPADKTALTGNPIRKEITLGSGQEAAEIFKLEPSLPVILIYGGSQGSEKINGSILDILPELLEISQVVHQCGRNNIGAINSRAGIMLEKSTHPERYHSLPYFDERELRNILKVANLAISRAGGGSLFEIAISGIPALVIPLPTSAQDHQRENAYAYARTGAAEVIEEANLTPHILLDRIKKLLADLPRQTSMIEAAKKFAKPDAADKIAREIFKLIEEHN